MSFVSSTRSAARLLIARRASGRCVGARSIMCHAISSQPSRSIGNGCCSNQTTRSLGEFKFSGPRNLDRSNQTRSLSDFSFAGPRKLDDIMKLDMIKEKNFSSTDVQDIWLQYHENKEHQSGIVIDGKLCKSILSRAAQCPFFIQPIFREDGYFTLVSQFQTPSHFMMAFLEDYKMDPARAQPLLTFSVFDDLVDSLDLGLVRLDVINKGIEDDEGFRCVQAMLDAYGKDDLFISVHAFNKKPETFDFDDYISQQNQKWKEDQDAAK